MKTQNFIPNPISYKRQNEDRKEEANSIPLETNTFSIIKESDSGWDYCTSGRGSTLIFNILYSRHNDKIIANNDEKAGRQKKNISPVILSCRCPFSKREKPFSRYL